MMQAVAEFWVPRDKYPPFPHRDVRLALDADFLAPRVKHAGRVLDLGAGDCALARLLLKQCSEIVIDAIDFSDALFSEDVQEPRLYRSQDDVNVAPFPPAGVAVMAGLAPSLGDARLDALLARLGHTTRRLMLRAPCALEARLTIHGPSTALGGPAYAAVYRTLGEVVQMLHVAGWALLECERAYPDEIESEFGTKQFWLVCRRA